MSGFKLRVHFGGVCAFVPQADGKRMWVFLVDARQPDTVLEDEPHFAPHLSLIRFNLADLEGAGGPRGSGFWKLQNADVEIWPGGQKPKGESLVIDGFGKRPENDSSFSWVAPVEACCKGRGHTGAGVLREDFLQAPPWDAGDRIDILAARIHLVEGTLQTTQRAIVDDDRGRPSLVEWRFRPWKAWKKKQDYRQGLASRVTLEIDVPHDYVELVATDLETGDPQGSLKLAPARDQRVTVTVFNESSDEILDVGQADPIKPGKDRAQDRVFQAFYQLSKIRPEKKHRVIPVAERFIPLGKPGRPPAFSSPPCSPARFEAVQAVAEPRMRTDTEPAG